MAALTAQVPARLLKKLDAAPRSADAWRWSTNEVVTDTGETVTLAADPIAEASQVRCTCLLSPRCFHVLAVASILELNEEPPASASASKPVAATSMTVRLDVDQTQAASQAWRAAAELLDAGAAGAGQTLQAELLRSVHSCRASGLVRVANAGVRVVRAVRDLRADSPAFSLRAYARDLAELLETARALGQSEVPLARVGVARRAYEPVRSLRLHGLFTEPVITGSGYAGVVTYLVDATGRTWSVSAVEPGEASRAAATYAGPAGLGDATLPHRELCREGLFMQDATGSADGRLGSGKDVRAVRAGPSPWTEEPVAALWRASLEQQFARARASHELPDTERPGGADLVFFQARVLGRCGEALIVKAGASALRCAARPEAQNDLDVLACAPGLELRCIARPLEGRFATLALLAVGPVDERLRLPTAWGGRANLGLDSIARSFVTDAAPAPVELTLAGTAPDPLDALRRRLERLALGGRSATSPEALAQVDQEARLLERRLMKTAATLHRALGVAAVEAGRTFAGTRTRGDAGRLASVWLAAAAFERRASRAV